MPLIERQMIFLCRKTLDYYGHHESFCKWLEENIEDCLAVFNLPPEYRRRLRTTNDVERMHEEINRRNVPIRIFPNSESALRLITALWQDIYERWITGKRYLNMDALQEWKIGEENRVEYKSNKGLNESHRKIRT